MRGSRWSSAWTDTWSRPSKRADSIARKSSRKVSSSPRVTSGCAVCRSDARSRSPSCAISRRAICGFDSVNALIVLSALNRKCGCSCARRLCSLASTSRRSRSAVQSASSCASRIPRCHLCGVEPGERDAGDDRVDGQIRIEPVEQVGVEIRGKGSPAHRTRGQTQGDRDRRPGEAERHVQSDAHRQRRPAGQPSIEPEDERRDQSPRIPARQRPRESTAPRQPCEIELRGKEAGERGPEQKHSERPEHAARCRPPRLESAGLCG